MKVTKPSTIVYSKEQDGPLKVVDSFGRLFYFRHLVKSGTHRVNIPVPGVYFFYGGTPEKIMPLVPVSFSEQLPKPERVDGSKSFTIDKTPKSIKSPARIYPQIGLIQISKKFERLPPPVKLFILLHEIGHLFYRTEEKCDLFALKNFLQMGYNQSTAFYSLSKLLGDSAENKKRILNLFQKTKNL